MTILGQFHKVVWASIMCTVADIFALTLFIISKTSHILVCLFVCPVRICCPLFWTVIVFLSIVMVHPSSYRTPKDMSGAVLIAGKTWIFLASLDSSGNGSVATCFDYMESPYGSLSSMVFVHVTGAIVGVSLLAKFMFAL